MDPKEIPPYKANPPPRTEPTLEEILPKDPDKLSRDELHDLFMELALRCFNKESQLDMLKELNGNYEKIIKDLREEIDEQMIEISDLRDTIPERPNFKNNIV